MVGHQLFNFRGHKYSGSGNIMFLVAKEEDSSCCCLNPPLLFIFKAHAMEAHAMSF